MVMRNTLISLLILICAVFVSMGSEPFTYKTKAGTKNTRYYSVPDEILEDHEKLADAQNRSVAFAMKTNYKAQNARIV